MRVLIVEDEKAAVRRLKRLLEELNKSIEVIGITDTIKETADWFVRNEMPDLAFFDIQLADGISFEVFNRVEIDCPIIFTTAYDQYALKAFEVNSIDFLLKPIDKEKLLKAIRKFEKLTGKEDKNPIDRNLLSEVQNMIRGRSYKERFVVKYGERLKSIPVQDIGYFKSEMKATYIITYDNQKYLIDPSLELVESMIDPIRFFRINRKYIIPFHSIQDMVSYSSSRLRVRLKSIDDPDMIVAREKVAQFKKWLDR
jgi:DNA-binding LytR/AlgR family response regulator